MPDDNVTSFPQHLAGRLYDPIDLVVHEVCLQACRTCGVDPDATEDAAVRGRVAEVSARITEEHPRIREIAAYFAQQGRIEDEEPRHG
jgi:hypothetical protein